MCAHVRRFCGNAAERSAASDAQPLTAMDWGSVFFTRVKKLMTNRIILENTAGEHPRQKLAALDDLLGIVIVVELALRHA